MCSMLCMCKHIIVSTEETVEKTMVINTSDCLIFFKVLLTTCVLYVQRMHDEKNYDWKTKLYVISIPFFNAYQ